MKVKLLKKLRNEAINNLDFIDGYKINIGRWITEIDGVFYTSQEVSRFKYLNKDSGYFIQNAIADRVIRMKENLNYSNFIYITDWYMTNEYIKKNKTNI